MHFNTNAAKTANLSPITSWLRQQTETARQEIPTLQNWMEVYQNQLPHDPRQSAAAETIRVERANQHELDAENPLALHPPPHTAAVEEAETMLVEQPDDRSAASLGMRDMSDSRMVRHHPPVYGFHNTVNLTEMMKKRSPFTPGASRTMSATYSTFLY